MKMRLKRSDILYTVMVCGLCLYYRKEIIQKTDEFFLSLVGKNLTGRNLLIRIAFWGGSFLICVLAPLLLRRLIGNRPKFRRAADALTLLILAVPMGQLLIICANQVLRRDDYWEIADARTYGFPGSILYEMRQWNGRYTGWGLKSLHAFLPDIPYIDIFLLINLVLLTAGTSMLSYRLLRTQAITKKGVSEIRFQAFLSGFFLTVAFIVLSSNTWEFWFWGSGTSIYGFGISMCILSTALVLNASDGSQKRPGNIILPALCCFLTCGCSELCTASLASFLFAILIRKRIRTGKWDRRILFLFAEVIILCSGIFLLSGSLRYANEYAQFEGSGLSGIGSDLLGRLPKIIDWAFGGLHGYTFIKYRELILLLLIAVLFGTQLRFDRETGIRILILAVFLTVIAHCVLLINASLNYVPPRVITVGICWFFTAMALVCVLIGSMIWREKSVSANRVTMIFCALFLTLSMNDFYQENIDTVRNVRSSWYIRDLLLRQHIGSEELIQTCSLPCPGSFQEDILEDPENAYNKAAGLFYEISAIAAEVRCPPYGEYYLPRDIWAEDAEP